MNEVISAAVKLIVALFSAAISCLLIPWIKNAAIPYLKEKRLYELCKKFTQAAHKLATTGAINKEDKKAYVLKLLAEKGYAENELLVAFVESAVEELDRAIESATSSIINVFDDGTFDEDEPQE